MSDDLDIEIVDSPRPESVQEELDVLFLGYRQALEEVLDILGVPGSPSLLDAPRYLRERLSLDEGTARMSKLSDDALRAILAGGTG